jgi:heterodisulfide reductase subunit B
MRYLYYPGCSLKGTARDYEESLLAVIPALGIELQELGKWRCCGASAARAKDSKWARALASATLAIAQDYEMDILMPCSSCYANHVRVLLETQKGEVPVELTGLRRIPRVKHLLEVLAQDLGPDEIRGQVVRPLTGLRVLPYYGCLVGRPFRLGGTESVENPQALERIVQATGAEALAFPWKLDCCGGPILFSHERVAVKLAGQVLKEAVRLSPHCLVVVCPLCHLMLDGKQRAVEKEMGQRFGLPVLYITQLLGLALGLDPRRLGMHRLITPSETLLARLGRPSPAR